MSDQPAPLADQICALFPGDSAAVSVEEAMALAARRNEGARAGSRSALDFFTRPRRPLGPYKAMAWGVFLLAVGVVVGVAVGTGQSSSISSPTSRVPTTKVTSPTTANPTYRPLVLGGPVSVSHLLAISFVDDEHGFAVALRNNTYGPTMLATTSDGGSSWVARGVLPAFPSDPSILFTSDTQGILWANGAQFIEHTSDGGRAWKRVDLVGTAVSASQSGDTIMLVDAGSCSPQDFLTSSPCATFIAWSDDGGGTWRQTAIADSDHESYGSGGEAGVLGDSSDAYVIAGSHLYVTTDAGSSWVVGTQPCSSVNNPGLDFPGYVDLSATEGAAPSLWAACGGQPSAGNEEKAVYLSTDGGTSWSLRSGASLGDGSTSVGSLPGYGYVGPIDALSPTRAYMALGRLGIVFSTDGGSKWQPTSTAAVASGGGGGTVDFVDATHGWALYSPLGFWRSTGGSAWKALDGTSG
jgi:photosystem II stability/assembly factor-like uncharacterized protein